MPFLSSKSLRRALILPPLLLSAGSALASGSMTFPPMKPGFWMSSMVMHMNMSGQPPDTDNTPMVRYNCVDAASMAAEMQAMSGAMPGCNVDIEGSGSVYTIAINCKNPEGQPGTLTSAGTITTDGETAMHMTETGSANMDNMKMTSDMTADYKWIGQCPAGVAPGDYGTMTNGTFTKQGNSLSPAK